MLRSACSVWAAKSSLSNTCSAVPADLAGDEDLLALGGDAVGKALGRGPMLGMENLHVIARDAGVVAWT